MFVPTKVSHSKQMTHTLSCSFSSLAILSGLNWFAAFFTLSLVEQEDPGALVTPPKTSAAGIFTFEDNQKGDFVLDVAPEPTKKNNKAVKAGKMTLEELQVRHSLLYSLCVA